ncbi:hypothetical protein JCM8097_001131 [Rhodosporidiobolus ruineniae]
MAFVYSVFYLWFEGFPAVFTELHGFSLGMSGLPYLTFWVVAIPTFLCYAHYHWLSLGPRLMRDPTLPPEIFLELGLYAAPFIPISLFIFGWTASRDVHWIAPTIGAGLFYPGINLSFNSIATYIAMSYPAYAASNLAGNNLFRSLIASVFPLFGAKFYKALGIGGGCSLLAGVALFMFPLLWTIKRIGPRLRARSKFA